MKMALENIKNDFILRVRATSSTSSFVGVVLNVSDDRVIRFSIKIFG